MQWGEIAVIIDILIGATGFCMMIVAFVLVARRSGWQAGMAEPIEQKRWPPQRWLMIAGAALALLFFIILFVLGQIPGGIPWIDRSSP